MSIIFYVNVHRKINTRQCRDRLQLNMHNEVDFDICIWKGVIIELTNGKKYWFDCLRKIYHSQVRQLKILLLHPTIPKHVYYLIHDII